MRLRRVIDGLRFAPQVLVLLSLPLPHGFAAAQTPTPISALEVTYRKQIFRNDRLAVFLLEIPPGHATLMHRHETDILSIFVSGGETKSTIYGKPPKEDVFAVGDVRFRPAGFAHSTENIGASTFRVVILEFSSSTGLLQPTSLIHSHSCNPDMSTACVDAKEVLCTDRFCVQDLKLAPGAILRNEASKNDQMLIAVSEYELSGGPKLTPASIRKRKGGEVEYLPGGSSGEWQNSRSETAHIIDVVFR